MSEWYIQPCERCGGAMKCGQVMDAIWAHRDAEACRGIIETDVRKQVAAEVLALDPWVVLGYSNLPDERLAQTVIGDIADRITRVVHP